MPTFADVNQEEILFREVEGLRNERAYVLKALVPNAPAIGTPTQLTAWLQIDWSGDFDCYKMTGRCVGPVNSSGVRLDGASTDFPMAGTTTGKADRGLSMAITALENGRTFTRKRQNLLAASTVLFNLMPVETILCPGYGHYPQPFSPIPFRQFMPRGMTYRFDLQNRDSGTGELGDPTFHRIDLVLIGKRYVK